jgi:hypothetical protein
MSPLLTTSVLPPDADFDVVLLTQAQSLDLARTVSAISRGGSLVVVGDPHLGPLPARDSVADLALSRLPSVTLHGAYRPVSSNVAALAAAVAAHLDGEGQPDGAHSGPGGVGNLDHVRLERVDGVGVLAPGASAIDSTEQEVQHVVRLVMDHALSYPDQSLAVVTLNRLHADLIRDAVRLERGVHPRVADFFDPDAHEPFLVVDASECAALVRDTVLLCVGYGRTPHGRVLHQFGAVGEPGGAELLLAAVTRARQSMVVVSSLGAEDLDPARLKTPGTRALRDVLAAAAAGGTAVAQTRPVEIDLARSESGPPPGDAPVEPAVVAPAEAPAVPSGDRPTDQPVAGSDWRRSGQGLDALLEDFALRLEADGLLVERSVPVGVPGGGPVLDAEPTVPVIDIAVCDEQTGRRLAVESDGPAYAALPGVRDRDRLRAEWLGRLGWEHLRVWSTDIFRDPAREVARVRAALDPTAPRSDARPRTEPQPTADSEPKPEQTRDDTDVGWGEVPPGEDAHDEWLREQRPPHWG